MVRAAASALVLFCTTLPTCFAADPVRLDAYGDPLPAGARVRLGTLRYRPASSSPGFALSPDGKIIAAGAIARIRLFDTATGVELRTIELPDSSYLETIVFARDGRRLAAIAEDKENTPVNFLGSSIYVAEVATGKVLFREHAPRIGFNDVALHGKFVLGRYGGRPEVDSEKEATIRVWDVTTGKEANRLPPARCFALTPDGHTIALGNDNHTIDVCELLTGKQRRRLKGHGEPIEALAFSPDGRTLASASGGTTTSDDDKTDHSVRLWDMATYKEVRRCAGRPLSIRELVFSPDGATLGAREGNKKIWLWDVASGKQLAEPVTGKARFYLLYAFVPGSKSLVWCHEDGIFHEWDIAAGKERRRWGAQGFTRDIAFTPDGKQLVAHGTSSTVWDMARAEEVHPFLGHYGFVEELTFSPDGRFLASVDNTPGLRLWDAASGRALPFRSPQLERIVRFHFTADSRLLVTVDVDARVSVWDPAAGWLVRQFSLGAEQPVRNWDRTAPMYHISWYRWVQDGMWSPLACDASGHLMAVNGADDVIRIWDLRTGVRVASLVGHRRPIERLQFAANARYLISTDENDDGSGLRVWDVAARREVQQFPLTKKRQAMALSPDSRLLALVVKDRVQLWDLDARKFVCAVAADPLSGRLGFGPAGTLLASWSEGQSICTWDTATGRKRRVFPSPEAGYADVDFFSTPAGKLSADAALDRKYWQRKVIDLSVGRAVAQLPPGQSGYAISPDGRVLASPADGGTLHEWASGAVIGRLPTGHRGNVSALAFSPDGKTLATGGSDTSILLWDWTTATGLISPKKDSSLDALWADLADKDAAKAWRALYALAVHDRGVTFLQERLKPATAQDAEPIRQLLADLDSRQFEVRENAFQALLHRGAEAEPFVHKALDQKPALEVTRRLEAFLARPESTAWSADSLRTIRAVQALEVAGSAAAWQTLEKLAAGATNALLTCEAKRVVHRLRDSR